MTKAFKKNNSFEMKKQSALAEEIIENIIDDFFDAKEQFLQKLHNSIELAEHEAKKDLEDEYLKDRPTMLCLESGFKTYTFKDMQNAEDYAKDEVKVARHDYQSELSDIISDFTDEIHEYLYKLAGSKC